MARREVREFCPTRSPGFPLVTTTRGPDVWSMACFAIVLESKSHPVDALLLRTALCQQFQWLVSSQILFRRKEIH
jgi:hypothetical protein